VQSLTDFGVPGYGGPCPPKGDRPHRYVFTVHALEVEKLDVDEKAMPAMVGFAINSNRIDKATLMSTYSRKYRGRSISLPALPVPSQSVALLAALMLRAPQTVSELRTSTERLHRFADASSVEGFLHELESRPAGALVAELPRQPGTRETRWTHLLSGAPVIHSTPAASAGDDFLALSEVASLKANLARLENEPAALKAIIAKV